MRSLLDVNVLVALFDERHIHNKLAHDWLGKNIKHGWGSCPITENGLIRILSNPSYSRVHRFTVEDIASRLRDFRDSTDHEFWPDSLSILDSSQFDVNTILGPRQLTDVYLLGLAANQGGRFVTFDRTIPIHAANQAKGPTLDVILN